jgi:hypothetical protein
MRRKRWFALVGKRELVPKVYETDGERSNRDYNRKCLLNLCSGRSLRLRPITSTVSQAWSRGDVNEVCNTYGIGMCSR